MTKKLITIVIALISLNGQSKSLCGFEKSFYEHIGFKPKTSRLTKKIKIAVVDLFIANHPCRELIDIDQKSAKRPIGELAMKFTKGSNKFHGLQMTLAIQAINPSAEVKFFSLTDLGDLGTAQVIKEAVDWGADLINYSIEGSSYFKHEHNAFKYAKAKGVTIIGAAGNDENNLDTFPAYPANYKKTGLDNLIVVTTQTSAVGNYSDRLVQFETYGTKVPSASTLGHTPSTGSSIATAITTGALSYLLSRFPTNSQQERLALLKNISKGGTGRSQYGSIDLSKLNKSERDTRSTLASLGVEKSNQ